jgi:hypothetical protein
MTIHPARAAAALGFAAAGFVVGIAVLAIVLVKLLVQAGMPVHPADLATLEDVVAVLPFVGAFAIGNLVAAVALLVGTAWAERLAFAIAGLGAAVGAFGLFLVVAGADPFAGGRAAQGYADGIGIMATFTVGYLLAFGLLAVAHLPVGRVARGARGAA